ncbi:MAG: Spy/CpxP family protein refolding chaperone [bacterium]|nr:Spy/CpxP family protein refolding chaperone [bacterium]
MKKSLIMMSLMSAFAIALTVPCFAADGFDTPPLPPAQRTEFAQKPNFSPEHAKKKAEFEKRLNLTDEQKAKAKELREQGHKEMKPLMDAIKAKHEELEAAKASKAADEEISKIKSDLKDLRSKIHEQRMKNMKDFESILTKKQLKELQTMKEEGRKNFEQKRNNCKCNCGCNTEKRGGDFKRPAPSNGDEPNPEMQ